MQNVRSSLAVMPAILYTVQSVLSGVSLRIGQEDEKASPVLGLNLDVWQYRLNKILYWAT